MNTLLITTMVSCFSNVFRETLSTHFVPDKSHKRILGGLKGKYSCFSSMSFEELKKLTLLSL